MREENTKFVFHDLGFEEFLSLYDKSYIFNISMEHLKNYRIPVNKVDTGESGMIRQAVSFYMFLEDIEKGDLGKFFVLPDGEAAADIIDYVDLEKCFTPITASSSGYYDLYRIINEVEKQDISIKGVLVITRTMSTYIGDKYSYGVTSEYFNFCPDELSRIIEGNPSLSGLLASKRKKVSSLADVANFLGELFNSGQLDRFGYEKYLSLLGI